MRRVVVWVQGVWLIAAIAAAPAGAQYQYLSAENLPFTAGVGTLGDLSFGGDEVGAIYSPLDGSLRFYRFTVDGSTLLDRTVGSAGSFYYEPSLCWDGTGYAIASSTITQAEFMRVSEAGDTIVSPTALPGIPSGYRTAALRIRCNAAGYSIFGLVLEPSFPGSTLYYTSVHYWAVDGTGAVQSHDDLGLQLAPISYIGTSGVGTEKEYYDVALVGDRIFVAYSAECGSPAVFQTCYSVFDSAGNVTRAEAPATTVTTKGPHLTTDGVTVGLATLRQEQMPPLGGGNMLYARFFDSGGAPLGVETRYDAAGDFPIGYAPTIFLLQGQFLPTYIYPDPFTLNYQIKYARFGPDGALVAAAQAVADPDNLVDGATINLGIDLQLVSAGTAIFGKGQDGFVTITPLVFVIPEPAGGVPLLAGALVLAGFAVRRRSRARASM